MTKIIKEKIKGTNRHWKNFLDKDYLGSHNLESGEEMILTIEKFIGEEEIKGTDGKKSNKPVLYFKENVPKMIMNITNGNTISTLYNSHPDGWIGKKVQIYTIRGKFFGKEQDALRIREYKPREAINIEVYKAKLDLAKTLEELGNIWVSFSLEVKSNEEVVNYKNELKVKLQ